MMPARRVRLASPGGRAAVQQMLLQAGAETVNLASRVCAGR